MTSSWNLDACNSWRNGTPLPLALPISTPPTPLASKVADNLVLPESEDRPDEWLETWVENISANLQGVSRVDPVVDNAWKRGSVQQLFPTSNANDLMESFKGVGFTEQGSSSSLSSSSSQTSESSSGDLVTFKSSSPLCHLIYFPSQFTARLIGTGGRVIESMKTTTKAKKLKMSSGILEVHGSFSIAQDVLLEVRNILKNVVAFQNLTKMKKKSQVAETVIKKTPLESKIIKRPSTTTASTTMEKSMDNSTSSNVFDCFNHKQEDKNEPIYDEKTKEEVDEANYDSTIQVGCAWVTHRQQTINMLEKNNTTTSSSSSSPFVRLNQDIFITILSYFIPSEAISMVASLGNTDRRLAYNFLTCYHRVWRNLATRSWPHVGCLRTKQPLLYPLACAMSQHRIITTNAIEPLSQKKKKATVSDVFHSINFNSISTKTMHFVYALELEYTLNPRTGSCDAARVKGVVVFPSFEAFRKEASSNSSVSSSRSSSATNPSILIPCFRGARQWNLLKPFAIHQLEFIGSLKKQQPHQPEKNHNNNRHYKPQQKPQQKQPEHKPSEIRLLAPLQPLCVAIKTYMVNACDGAGLDIDSFVAIWRLMLALTDPHDRVGLARRRLVQSMLMSFQKNKYDPPDLGNFIAYLLIIDPSSWSPFLKRYLNKGMCKNVLWSCRELTLQKKASLIRFYKSSGSVGSDSEMNDFLNTCFQAGLVSRRTVLFWVALQRSIYYSDFLGLKTTTSLSSSAASTPTSVSSLSAPRVPKAISMLERDRAELIHGFVATSSLKDNMDDYLNTLNNLDSWAKLFQALGSVSSEVKEATEISKDELLNILQLCWKEGLAKQYFTEDMDFGKVHARGGSNLFLIGNRFNKAAFMLDRSGSMSCYTGTDGGGYGGGYYDSDDEIDPKSLTRFDAVKQHLLSLLELKSVDFAFSVHLFDTGIYSFKDGKLQQNTPAIRKQLRVFFDRIGCGGGTDLVNAMHAVTNVEGAQECFLLTDGCGGGEREMIALARNSFEKKRVPVHCIGIEGSNAQSLARVARAGGGEFSDVDSKTLAEIRG